MGFLMEFFVQIIPFIIVFAILYFMIIRPQQQRLQQHREMIANIRRGDIVITGGGIIGKVAKVVDEEELLVEIADGVRVRLARGSVSELKQNTEPAPAESDA